MGVIWADALESPIYGYSHLSLGNKQTKKAQKDWFYNFFFPQEPTQQGRKFPLLGDQWAFLQKKKFNLQQSSCILRHSGTHHTSIVLLAKKPAPHMEVRGEPLDFSRSKCISLTPSPIVQGKSVFPEAQLPQHSMQLGWAIWRVMGGFLPLPYCFRSSSKGALGLPPILEPLSSFPLLHRHWRAAFLPFEDQRGRQGGGQSNLCYHYGEESRVQSVHSNPDKLRQLEGVSSHSSRGK